jgi:hypothetical protein
MHISDMSAHHCTENVSGICGGLLVMHHLLKTIENQDFEMAFISADNKELLQVWYELDGPARTTYYRLQPTASHISRLEVWNEIYIFIQNRDN